VHYQLWSKVLNILTSKKHLTMEGLTEIVSLKQHSPKGLSKSLASQFTDIKSIFCPNYSPNFSNLTVDWLAGFINADGNFGLRFRKLVSKTSETCCGEIVIVQHNISLLLLLEIVKFLGIGKIYHRKSKEISILKISNLKDLNLFIDKLALSNFLGSKALDYTDFVRGITLIKNKAHLTKDGLKELKFLSKGMNKNRSDKSSWIFSYLSEN
jgi:hypothetical protein